MRTKCVYVCVCVKVEGGGGMGGGGAYLSVCVNGQSGSSDAGSTICVSTLMEDAVAELS